ncbi:MAG: heme NO-binding domain-containing protein [Flavihumibacter sp.]|nr:heme NO-binding domain-containing protein [Flavihumibacter sp.]
MYGIVNVALEEMVISNYGQDKWEEALHKSGAGVFHFEVDKLYDDEVTYLLVASVAEVLEMNIHKVMNLFGEWWILKVGTGKHANLMASGGESLKEFLINLPTFHSKVILIYVEMFAPQFTVTDVEANSLVIHYYSNRRSLTEFVRGLLLGLGKMFKTPVSVILLNSRNEGADHDTFRVSWN